MIKNKFFKWSSLIVTASCKIAKFAGMSKFLWKVSTNAGAKFIYAQVNYLSR